MKKSYIKPEMKQYEMLPLSIMSGSVTLKPDTKIAVSSFFTDDADWSTDSNGNKSYNFWTTE